MTAGTGASFRTAGIMKVEIWTDGQTDLEVEQKYLFRLATFSEKETKIILSLQSHLLKI